MSILKPITITAAVGLLVSLGCTPPPPPIPARRPEVPINASFNATWDAALASFAARNISVNKDRLSGTIAADMRDVLAAERGKACGTNKAGEIIYAEMVKYRVEVKGDSASSKLQAAAIYLRNFGGAMSVTECPSDGKWEADFEADVKQRAEQR